MKLSMLAVAGLLLVGTSPTGGRLLGQSVDELEIRSLEDRERMAVLAEDTSALANLWATELIVNYPMNGISPDRATVFGSWRPVAFGMRDSSAGSKRYASRETSRS